MADPRFSTGGGANQKGDQLFSETVQIWKKNLTQSEGRVSPPPLLFANDFSYARILSQLEVVLKDW